MRPRRPHLPHHIVTAHESVQADLKALYALDAARLRCCQALSTISRMGAYAARNSEATRQRRPDRTRPGQIDVTGYRPERFRLIYRETGATRHIIAIGPREQACDLPRSCRSPTQLSLCHHVAQGNRRQPTDRQIAARPRVFAVIVTSSWSLRLRITRAVLELDVHPLPELLDIEQRTVPVDADPHGRGAGLVRGKA